MATFHMGDCSTDCDECARRCADGGHGDCIGTPEDRARGDRLLTLQEYETNPYREPRSGTINPFRGIGA